MFKMQLEKKIMNSNHFMLQILSHNSLDHSISGSKEEEMKSYRGSDSARRMSKFSRKISNNSMRNDMVRQSNFKPIKVSLDVEEENS